MKKRHKKYFIRIKRVKYQSVLSFVDNWLDEIKDPNERSRAKTYWYYMQNNELKKCILDFSKKDYKDRDFSDGNFAWAEMAGLNFEGSNFNGSCLAGANLSGANLTNTNFRNVEFCGEYGPVADFTNGVLVDAKIPSLNQCFIKSQFIEMCGVIGFETIDWGKCKTPGQYVCDVLVAMTNDISHNSWNLHGVSRDEEEVLCAKKNLRKLRIFESRYDEVMDTAQSVGNELSAALQNNQDSFASFIDSLLENLLRDGLDIQLSILLKDGASGLIGASRDQIESNIFYLDTDFSNKGCYVVKDIHLTHARLYKKNALVLTLFPSPENPQNENELLLVLVEIGHVQLQRLIGWIQAYKPNYYYLYLPFEKEIVIEKIEFKQPLEHKVVSFIVKPKQSD
ncbi:MAG: pentapeptide repeat-containing protein [Candidatus Aminicenantes bacterium]|nr:MAG: pentapeptide repeat-containing protein [Candidatus Aminicenantes bacterium]